MGWPRWGGVCCLTILVGRFLPAGGFRRHIIEFSNYCLGFWIYLVFFFALLDIALILRKRVETCFCVAHGNLQHHTSAVGGADRLRRHSRQTRDGEHAERDHS